MDFSDYIYDDLKIQIKNFFKEGVNWEQIENLDLPNMVQMFTKEYKLSMILYSIYHNSNGPDGNTFSVNDWENLVSQVRRDSKERSITRLSGDQVNDATIPIGRASQWKGYEKKMLSSGFSLESVQEIRDSAYAVLQKLKKDTSDCEPVKGLVVGDVQSGKTANMAALISMAADYGFNYFIIFSGIIENLRQQTADRMYEDLSKVSSKYHWYKKDNPSKGLAERDSDFRWENLPLKRTNNKYFTVCLKQSNRIESLTNWLYSDPNKIKDMKVLIIDDEADQASINTKEIKKNSKYSKSIINKSLLKLVQGYEGKKIRAVNYVSYTATPYANVLNEAGNNTLYPKDFIVSLEPSSDYIGPKKIFGLMDPEQTPDIDIQRSISKIDVDTIHEIHKNSLEDIPLSLKTAINWFILTGCSLRAVNFKDPVSMLIHTSHKVNHHKNINEAVQRYLDSLSRLPEKEALKIFERLFIEESGDFTKEAFLDGMPNYSVSKADVKGYPLWEEVSTQLLNFLRLDKIYSYTSLDKEDNLTYTKGIHIAVDNSSSSIPRDENEIVRLHYPKKGDKSPAASMFLVIGGNTLSRGLTLKGLTTSYFCRNTNLGDTLMQMGRWFGYRKGYEIYPRVWLNDLSARRFEFLAQLNEELREEIKEMSRLNQQPKRWAIKIKNSPKLNQIRITAQNKSQGAMPKDLDYTGEKPQTTVFKNDIDILKNNLEQTELFLNSLNVPDDNFQGRLIWREIEFSKVRDYLKKMNFHERSRLFNILPMLDWYEGIIQKSGFKNWSVVLSSIKDIKKIDDTENRLWDIHGYDPKPVRRSRKNDPLASEADIGVLRTLRDEVIDIPDISLEDLDKVKADEINQIRRKYGYSLVPQLVIYRIDKKSNPESKVSKNRHPLGLLEDAIGIFIRIPGAKKGSSLATKVAINLEDKYTDNDYAEEE